MEALTEGLLYRQFEIRCSERRLVELSAWLNEHLDWEHGEDFDKIEILKNENIEILEDENIEILKNENIEILKDAHGLGNIEILKDGNIEEAPALEILKDGNIEEPSGKVGEGSHDPDWEALVCKTDRETLADYLVWMADYVEAHRDGSTRTDNRVRITRNLARKLRK